MDMLPIAEVIPERDVVMFAPHYDDFLFGLGGYALELKTQGLLDKKRFHILLIFSRSNYQVRSGAANFDTSLERIKLASGRRLIEELDCLDEIFDGHNYRFELLGERECFLRDKVMADSEMEFPHGTYADFNEQDRETFARLQAQVHAWSGQAGVALVFPLAIKEHIDHFITREAGITVARKLGSQARARFYFQEDKPYAGIQTPEERARMEEFVAQNGLQPRLYRHHPEKVVELAFRHYVSQVEEVYRTGVLQRATELQVLNRLTTPADQLFAFLPA